MSNYCTMFGYSDHHDDLHCTHKYLGDLSTKEVLEVSKIIDDYFKDNPFTSFSPVFEEEDFFGPNNEVRVLKAKNPKSDFLLDLKKKLDKFRKDDYSYNPHVTTDLDKVSKSVTRYILTREDDIVREWK